MIILLIIASVLQTSMMERINFGNENSTAQSWFVVNDGVMGGVSSGKTTATDSSIIWRGYISFENNGGFSAFRSQLGNYDLSTFSEVRIKYRSAGQALDFALYPYRAYYMPNYKVHLGDTEGVWQEKSFRLDEFEKYVLGRSKNDNIDSESLSNIIRLGFINGGKKEGGFEFEIDYIEFK